MLARRIVVLLAVALTACSGATKPSLPPTLVASSDRAAVDHGPSLMRRPMATPGEHMTYRVSIHGIELAEFVLVVGEPTELDGVPVVVVQSAARPASLLAWVTKEKNEFSSWIDVSTGLSRRFVSTEVASRTDPTIETTESRFEGDGYDVTSFHGDDPPSHHRQVVAHGGHDLNSFLIYLRGWEAEPGARIVADVQRSYWPWRAEVVVAAYDNLDTRLGQLPVVRFDGESVRLRKDGTVDPESDRRHFSIWISDDSGRVPVRVVARTDFGDLKMDLVSYTTGGRVGQR